MRPGRADGVERRVEPWWVEAMSAPTFVNRLLKASHDLVFHHVHGSQLIYNTCWEDPRIDRELLGLGPDSRVVLITSAGCNALDYLLDAPAEVHAVDVNFRQNALLELKLALLRRGDFGDLFECFGHGAHPRFRGLLRAVRPGLPSFARDFWAEHVRWFDPHGMRRSFYYQGASGTAAWLMGGALFKSVPNIRNLALSLLDSDSPEEQARLYALLEPKVWSGLNRWLVRQRPLMTLLGVPAPQIRLIETSYPGGLTAYVKDKLRHVFAALPLRDNYFWRVYMTGSYTPGCCPNYLRAANLPHLQERAGRVRTYTTTLTRFLQEHPGRYTHFVLLDHLDWLAHHDPVALAAEWEQIFANSAPGARVLLRSAGLDLGFLPVDIRSRLRLQPERTEALHRTDRVGTYGSLHFAEIL
jgi:S-adenosylmethionine-diacylglycerol 3-amino-3-carboxypropyl transferase